MYAKMLEISLKRRQLDSFLRWNDKILCTESNQKGRIK